MINAILNVVFPTDCVVCGEPVTEWRSGAVCSACADGFQRLELPLCQRCGHPRSDTTDQDCPRCRGGRTRFDFGRSALVFDEPLRNAIHHFKYNDRVSLRRPFGRALAECHRRSPFVATRVIPVPLHRKRERHRGYNQATLLARSLGLEVETNLVRRKRDTATQTGLSRNQRIENVRNAFECRKPAKGTWLVVDDVMTTGATINEVVRILKKRGASRVEVLTLTRIETTDL